MSIRKIRVSPGSVSIRYEVQVSTRFGRGATTVSERDQYVEKTKAKLDQWNAEIDKVEAKMKEAEADAKLEYQKQLDEMRKRRNEAEAGLKEVADAGDQAWDDVRHGFERAWGSLSEAFERARSRFK